MMNEETVIQPFPAKPAEVRAENPWMKSLLSLLLFVVSFYFLFDKDIEYILLLVVVLLIHETGHFVAMKYYHYKDVRMFFIPLLGAMVSGDKQHITQKQRTVILLAGPLPGILIGVILHLLALELDNPFMYKTAGLFIFINIFNLLPVTPLDGGNLLETLFLHSAEMLQNIFLVVSALLMALIAIYTQTYILLLIPMFLFMRINYKRKQNRVRKALISSGLNYDKPLDELSDAEYWLIRQQMLKEMKLYRDVDPADFRVNSREQVIINHMKALLQPSVIPDLGTGAKLFVILIWIIFSVLPVLMMIGLRNVDRYETWVVS